jgi:Bifunctional DNA primase/polymerase, N-terminal
MSAEAKVTSALTFIQLGCRVVAAEGKKPGVLVGGEWNRKATRDAETIRGWWRRWPAANIGIVPGRDLLPVDVDHPEAFEAFERGHGKAPPTPTYYTGGASGRRRLLFQHPGVELNDMLCPGVQLRDGERVSIVPPGVNPDSGEAYEWIMAADEVPIAPMPSTWIEIARVKKNNPMSVGRPVGEWAEIFCRDYVTGCGETHPNTMKMAAYLVKKLGSGQLALELMLGWNRRRCNPPKPEREIVEQVRWAAQREARR